MARARQPEDTRTPFQRFTDAGRHVFNVPKADVEKLAATKHAKWPANKR